MFHQGASVLKSNSQGFPQCGSCEISLSGLFRFQMVELSVLSSWKEMVKGQIEEGISKLKQNFKQMFFDFDDVINIMLPEKWGLICQKSYLSII